MKEVIATIVVPVKDNKVLLAKRTRKIAVGKWNGFGGKLELGESIKECAIRELEEESGLVTKADNLDHRGVITFKNYSDKELESKFTVYFYLTRDFSGTVEQKLSEGMIKHTWFDIDDLPYNEMQVGDKFFFGRMLRESGLNIIVEQDFTTSELISEVKIEKLPVPTDINYAPKIK